MLPPKIPDPTFGYLLFHQETHHGWTGGLLVVSVMGRPLEFHCTEPILPNKAEEILYGDTLQAHIVGERIAPALLSKVKTQPELILTLDPASADISLHRAILDKIPNLLIVTEQSESWQTIGNTDHQRLIERLAETIDPCEPFERIREAIHEAHRMTSEEDGDVAQIA